MTRTVNDIDKLEIGVRAYKALTREGWTSFEQLCAISIQDLARTPNIGMRTVIEIMKAMREHGMRLCPHDSDVYWFKRAVFKDLIADGLSSVSPAMKQAVQEKIDSIERRVKRKERELNGLNRSLESARAELRDLVGFG